MIAQGFYFLTPTISAKLKQGQVTPNGSAKCRWDTLIAGAVAENWPLATRGVVNFGREFITLNVHLICLQHVRRDAARRAGLSGTADPC